MFHVSIHCDFCGKEIPMKEFKLLESSTKEINLKNLHVCEVCALKIDNAVLRFRAECNQTLR